jgi:hypothetical protein
MIKVYCEIEHIVPCQRENLWAFNEKKNALSKPMKSLWSMLLLLILTNVLNFIITF